MELTIQQACERSASFMYLWADEDKFLKYIKNEYAAIIRGKKANQKKLILLSAQKYINPDAVWGGEETTQYTSAIREAFVEQYDHTPAEALIILAQGGSIAGKNWSEGVFGIGALPTSFGNNANINVDTKTGHIYNGGTDITDTSKTVYSTVRGQVFPIEYVAELDGVTYISEYHKTKRKYYANTYSTADGTFNAKTGNVVSASDGADIWGNILESLQTFLSWLMSLFGINFSQRETISAENTLPSQKADGFTQEAGIADAAGLLLILAAGGALIATGGIKVGKKAKQ